MKITINKDATKAHRTAVINKVFKKAKERAAQGFHYFEYYFTDDEYSGTPDLMIDIEKRSEGAIVCTRCGGGMPNRFSIREK